MQNYETGNEWHNGFTSMKVLPIGLETKLGISKGTDDVMSVLLSHDSS